MQYCEDLDQAIRADHSSRNATTGSTRVARIAGTNVASAATPISVIATTRNVLGSLGFLRVSIALIVASAVLSLEAYVAIRAFGEAFERTEPSQVA